MSITIPVKMAELSNEFKKQYVQNLHGRDHMTVMGAIILAQEYGLKSIDTDLIQAPNAQNGNTAIVKATVIDKDGNSFSGIGDANVGNVNRMVAPAIIRMAETRALGRACRWLLGLNTLSDEIYTPEPITAYQINDIAKLVKDLGFSKEEANRAFTDITGKIGLANATKDEASIFISTLKAKKKEQEEAGA